MSKIVWASVISGLLILGAGTGGGIWVHQYAAQQLDGEPLLAVEAEVLEEVQDSTTQAEPMTRKEIIEESQKRVVTIETGGGLGSGFLYNNQGDLLTNAHVVEGWHEVTVTTLDHEKYTGIVIGIGTDTDIAVVRVLELKDITPLPIARTYKAEVGDEVLALGSPLGLENTVTTGIVSGVGRNLEIDPYIYNNLYQISAPITNGNSGGPLVNALTGEVLGINSAAATEEAGIGFSIPISSILKQVEEWSKHPEAESEGGADNSSNSNSAADVLSDSSSIVTLFYDSLSTSDYVTAYSLLGSQWQGGTSYEDFRKGYLNTGEVVIESISSVEDDGGKSSQVSAIITAEERRDGETVYQQYQLNYTVGNENGQLKILNGKGKKID
ncbi:S1C family serine protease [Paenibacillus wynnii]|uniref:S1C family serine protease n=1 Tax=Paenibacillus wynnii TaxID=268407 RepID=UPI00278D1A22|nr:trypsin-like peptidase domain-containing protein [Paenibacillus wynnii]MDQ0194134.1 S1-C subfamily serine protease [Paenibacillus wynnii]